MKRYSYLLFAFCLILMVSCAQETPPEEQSPQPAAAPAQAAPTQGAPTTDLPPGANTPIAANNSGTPMQHYYCPNRCAGSGGPTGGKCPTCGADYVHNDAYHLMGNAAAPTGQPAQAAEPPQNAKGIWHYSCPKGCPGGSGGPGACATCGTALAHDGRYHDQ